MQNQDESQKQLVQKIIALFNDEIVSENGGGDLRYLLESAINDGIAFNLIMPNCITALFRGDEVVVDQKDWQQFTQVLGVEFVKEPCCEGEAWRLPGDLARQVWNQLETTMDVMEWFTATYDD